MIEQYSIATTPKYNFPHPTINATLPKRFTEQSIHSLKLTRNPSIQLNHDGSSQINDFDMQTQTLSLNAQAICLNPRYEETTVAACDTSTVKIGETSTGMLIAVRGATVWKQSKNYRYTRFGPFIFHITEENKREVYGTLERAYFNSPLESHQSIPSLTQMPTRIANILERWLQAMLASTTSNGLVLFDGSLTAGTGDTPTSHLKEILNNARKKGNTVLAFSKMTSLRINGQLITDIPLRHRPPCLLETTGLKTKPPIILLGDVYVVRLTHGNCAFRLDIDKENSSELKIEAVEKLLGNDVHTQSYPETLRFAHILCTFTANEVIAMQRLASLRYGVRIINRPDMHRLLFGPFGGGEGYS